MSTRIIRYPSGYSNNGNRSEYNRGYESRRTRNDNRYRGDRAYGEDMAYNRRGNRGEYRNDYRNEYRGYEQNYSRDYARDYPGSYNDYGGMRQIGFADGDDDYEMRMHGGGHSGGRGMEMGHGSSSEYGLSYDEAEEWVKSMKNADGSKGGKWKMEELESVLRDRGIKCDILTIYAGMNALYSDLGEVCKKYGIKDSDVNFWLEMAIAYWLEDEDAVEDKLTVYYDCIVK